MTVPCVVVVPWLPDSGCAQRARNWRWLQSGFSLPTREAHGSVPWVKALAVMPTLRRLRCEIAVVCDADVLIANAAVEAAVAAVASGAPWAIPHLRVSRLTARGTEALLRYPWDSTPGKLEEEQAPYVGVEGGGCVVVRREDALRVPLDPRFVGWGQEDESWAFALRTLVGPPWRGDVTLTHLWHPPQPRMTRRRGSAESWRLRKRYHAARHNVDDMRTVIGEACAALAAAQPAVPHHAQTAV